MSLDATTDPGPPEALPDGADVPALEPEAVAVGVDATAPEATSTCEVPNVQDTNGSIAVEPANEATEPEALTESVGADVLLPPQDLGVTIASSAGNVDISSLNDDATPKILTSNQPITSAKLSIDDVSNLGSDLGIPETAPSLDEITLSPLEETTDSVAITVPQIVSTSTCAVDEAATDIMAVDAIKIEPMSPKSDVENDIVCEDSSPFVDIQVKEEPVDDPTPSEKPVRKKRKRQPIDIPEETRKILQLQIFNVKLPNDCILDSGRVSLKVLRRARPEYFRDPQCSNSVKLGKRKLGRPSNFQTHEEQQHKRGRKKSTEEKTKRAKGRAAKVNVSDVSSGSDSDLEELRAKIKRPNLKILSSALGQPTPSSSAAESGNNKSASKHANKIKSRAVIASSSDSDSEESKASLSKGPIRARSRTRSTSRPRNEEPSASTPALPSPPNSNSEATRISSTDSRNSTEISCDITEPKEKKAVKKDKGAKPSDIQPVTESVMNTSASFSESSRRPKSSDGPSVELSLFEKSKDMKRFKDILQMEVGSLFPKISKKTKTISIADLETLVNLAIDSYGKPANTKPSFVPSKPKEPLAAVDAKIRRKHNIKGLSVTIKDVASQKRYKERVDTASQELETYKKRRDRKRKEVLLSGLKLVKDSVSSKRKRYLDSSDSEEDTQRKEVTVRKKHRFLATEDSEDHSRLGQFKIPKKDKDAKVAKKIVEAQAKREPISTTKYNLSYNQRPGEQQKSHNRLKERVQKKTFDHIGKETSNAFNVLDLVKMPESKKREKNEFGDIKAKEKSQELKSRKVFEPPVPKESSLFPFDPVVDALMRKRVRSFKGEELDAFRFWTDNGNHYFQCQICDAKVDGVANLKMHVDGARHFRSMRGFRDITGSTSTASTLTAKTRAKSPLSYSDLPSEPVHTPEGSPLGDDFASDTWDDGPSTSYQSKSLGLNLPKPVPILVQPVPASSSLPNPVPMSVPNPQLPRPLPTTAFDPSMIPAEPVPPPALPVPPPTMEAGSSTPKLSLDQLNRLPTPMSFKDRVENHLQKSSVPGPQPTGEKNDDNLDDVYDPGRASPLWQVKKKLPQPSKEVGEFNIDPNGSFMDGENKPIELAQKVAEKPKPKGLSLKPIASLQEKTSQPASDFTAFLDQIINCLKKPNKKTSVPASGPPLPPPLPGEPPPPPPPLPAAEEGVSPPHTSFGDNDAMVNRIVSEIDHHLPEQEKFAKAREKLTKYLHRRQHAATDNLINPLFLQPPPPYLPGHPVHLPPPQGLHPLAPPLPPGHAFPPFTPQPPPRNEEISENEISNFMSQYCEDSPSTSSGPPPASQPSFSSALAKLRARKSQKASGPGHNTPPEKIASPIPRPVPTMTPPQPPPPRPVTLTVTKKLLTSEQEALIHHERVQLWNSLILQEWSKVERDFRVELQEKQRIFEQSLDLGTRFHDLTLNQRVINKSGNPIEVFSCWDEDQDIVFRCNVCNVQVCGKNDLDSHVSSEDHSDKMEETTQIDPTQPVPPGEVAPIPEEPIITKLLDMFKEAPMIGIEFLVEIHRGDKEPLYHCFLCSRGFERSGVIEDLVSAEHRLAYLKRFFPTGHRKFAKVPNLGVWKKPTFDFLESSIRKIEQTLGRLKPLSCPSEDNFVREQDKLLSKINDASHFGESPDLDFSNLPDPFGSYLSEINPREFDPAIMAQQSEQSQVKDVGLDHIEDPEMQSLMQREIARFRQSQAEPSTSGDTKTGEDSHKKKQDDEDHQRSHDSRRRVTGKLYRPRSPDLYKKPRHHGSRPTGGASAFSRQEEEESHHYRHRRRTRSRSRSPSSRHRHRTRSRSRSRSPRRHHRRSRRSRSRSLSPYTSLYERWKRFKQAEKVMLSAVNRKRDIYDKRPEDHPNYADEWKDFWENRYKELQLQGKNPENHDFKADWIPFWGKRVDELFDREILEKTDALLERFDLESGREPVREDFPPSSRPDEFDDFEDFQRDYEDFRRGNAEEGEIEVIRERRRPRDMMSRSPSYNRDRDRDRDRGRSHHNHHHRDRSGSPRSWRTYSGISDLEDRRDGGRNYFDRSPRRYEGFDDVLDEGPVQVVPFLRLLTALEDILGSLGPNVNAILGRALSLEQNRPGASNILLEDPETACILDMTKEKLSGLMMAGLLEESKQGAVRVVMDHMARVLRQATRKRPDKPPTLGKAKSKKDQLKEIVANQLSKVLVQRGMSQLSDYDLHCLVFKVIEKTELDDGSIAPPSYATYCSYNQPAAAVAYQNTSAFQSTGSYYTDTKPFAATTQASTQPHDALDEFDELTIDELRSLLNNFKNLAKTEQKDLIQYMRKLEHTNPGKVAQLKANKSGPGGQQQPQQQSWEESGMFSGGSSVHDEDGRSQSSSDRGYQGYGQSGSSAASSFTNLMYGNQHQGRY